MLILTPRYFTEFDGYNLFLQSLILNLEPEFQKLNIKGSSINEKKHQYNIVLDHKCFYI